MSAGPGIPKSPLASFLDMQEAIDAAPDAKVGTSVQSCPPPEKPKKPPVTVKIQEVPKAVIVLTPRGQAAPTVLLHAVNATPSGGDFSWTAQPSGKVSIDGPIGESVLPLTGLARGAVPVEVKYTFEGESATDRTVVEVRAPLIEAAPAPREFSTTAVGKHSEACIVSVQNTGDAPLRVSYALNPDNGHFTIENSESLRRLIEPGDPAVKVRLLFTPQEAGDRASNLVITSNACNKPEILFPLHGKTPERAWVEIRLLNMAGEAQPGDRYILHLPDNTTREGTLDSSGVVRVEDIDPGTCEIEFPDLDKDAWEPAK